MPKRTPTTDHLWVGAGYVTLTDAQAKYAEWRDYVEVKADVRVKVIEVYCLACRRPYEDVADQDCLAADKDQNQHLIGGPVEDVRKKRPGQPVRPGYEPLSVEGSLPLSPPHERATG